MYQNPYVGNYSYNPNYYGQLNQSQYQNQYQSQPATLLGKFVDNIDVARAQEVPMGQMGFFPKADHTSIYVKSWCSDGTTKIDEYQKSQDESIEFHSNFDTITAQINTLSEKIDTLKSFSTKKKKVVEVEEDD